MTGKMDFITQFEVLTGYKISLLLSPITKFKIFSGYKMLYC